MNHKHLHHQNAFHDAWAILRQPSTMWVARQLVPHLNGPDQRLDYLDKQLPKEILKKTRL